MMLLWWWWLDKPPLAISTRSSQKCRPVKQNSVCVCVCVCLSLCLFVSVSVYLSVQGAYRSWKVMENKPNGCHISEPCTFLAFTYIIVVHCQTLFDLLFSIIMNCVTYSVLYENLTCSISTRLNSTGKTWKMDINGPGKCLSVCMLCVSVCLYVCVCVSV